MSGDAIGVATIERSSIVGLSEWQTVPLADVADISRGTSWARENEHREPMDGALPVLGIKNVQARLETGDLIWLSGLKPSAIASSTVQTGDILMVGSNGNPDRIGNAVKVDEPGRYLFASLLFALRPRREIVDPDFLYQAIIAPGVQTAISDAVQGTTGLSNLKITTLRDLPILLPPLDEQRRIAEVLRSVDEAIARTQDAADAAVATQQATFAAFLRSGNEATENSAVMGWTTGRIESVKRLPQGWQIVRLVDVARLESGHTPDRKKPDYWNGGDIEWISLHDTKNLEKADISQTEWRITQAGLANSSARMLPAGTVCFSRTATVGKCVIMAKSMATSQDFANFVCSAKLNNRYLLHLLRWMQPVWKSLASGSTHQTIYMPTFKALQIVLPPRPEQDAIAEAMDGFVSVIDGYVNELEQLRTVKTSLMSDLLSGRVRVPA